MPDQTMTFDLPPKDRSRLRELAARQAEQAAQPVMRQRTLDWVRHNDLTGQRPMIHLELWTFAGDIIPQRLQCASETGRGIERQLLENLVNFELFDDDKIVPPFFPIRWQTWFQLFGIEVKTEQAADTQGRSLGYRFQYVLDNLAAGLPKLGPSTFGVDREATMLYKHKLEALFGDLLPVRLIGASPGFSLTYQIVQLMGMENMFLALYDQPDELHALSRRITDDFLTYFRFLEAERLLLPCNSYAWLGQGSWGFTTRLPGPRPEDYVRFDPAPPVRLDECWGYMDSQETVGVSPDMFHEHFFPYYREMSACFGLLSYGCCEPADPLWDASISQLEHLGKVSISPWCNEEKMGQQLRGKPIIYHRKPSPNFLGVGYDFDEAGFRSHIEKTMRAASGCHLEFALRDIYTLEGNLEKAKKAVAIIRELGDKLWTPPG